jgi:hypothetical protein
MPTTWWLGFVSQNGNIFLVPVFSHRPCGDRASVISRRSLRDSKAAMDAKATHLPALRAVVKNMWNWKLLPHMHSCHGAYLIRGTPLFSSYSIGLQLFMRYCTKYIKCLTFCWPCIIVTQLRNKHNQLDAHFTFTFTLFRFKVSTCFGH